jgi:hypothetical protein
MDKYLDELCKIVDYPPCNYYDYVIAMMWKMLLEKNITILPELRNIIMEYWRPCVCYLDIKSPAGHFACCIYTGTLECTYCMNQYDSHDRTCIYRDYNSQLPAVHASSR